MIAPPRFYRADKPTLRKIEPTIAHAGGVPLPGYVCSFTGKQPSDMGVRNDQISRLETEVIAVRDPVLNLAISGQVDFRRDVYSTRASP